MVLPQLTGAMPRHPSKRAAAPAKPERAHPGTTTALAGVAPLCREA